ncbi:TIGR04053 family radical SAM/SPASM domain-containing protein [Paludisphaera mucosa]|uniref:TIGR04053 family radical SAM/SPASM domain-containing protein n=1 Tax=Paludisphaera mucosa TaxID=3030827 RepID=A0ABT6FHJ0_9BACT|nr:TIGR04053 family radical SAM/SPASM domain-containing protein [Paludisphaera mucosa]MDG3007042.1 TIGR04053 family radical SAM/SPASM domain-containing protein [Paludisphaera mucosa]
MSHPHAPATSAGGPPPDWARRRNFDSSPLIAFYEITRACDLVCLHCRACAQAHADPAELDTAASLRLIDQLASFPEPPLLVFTGGDPLKRADLFELIRHANGIGLQTAITPSPTPLVTADAIRRLKAAGIGRMAVSLDGVDAPTHDAVRGVAGSFAMTQTIMDDAREAGVPVQVNTTLTPGTFGQLEAIADLLEARGIALWSLFLIIPVGRATADLRLDAERYEQAFARLWKLSRQHSFMIKTTEGMHYRRYVLQRRKESGGAEPMRLSARGWNGGLPGVNDGRGILFVSHAGLIHPSGFLPLTCGMFPFNDVVDVYQRSPIFRRLRDADSFGGKCGVCEYRHICGGSRARAFAVTGDPYAAEPDCLHIPRAWDEAHAVVPQLVD